MLYAGVSGDKFVCTDDNKTPSCSTSRKVETEENGIERMERPAKSLDCNPIKNLWDNIKRKATKVVKDDTSLLVSGGVPSHFAV